MRKHFLILMLMALLPLAGWAGDGDITTAPAAKTGLIYTGSDQELVTAATVEGDGYQAYYAVVNKDAPKPTWTTGEGNVFTNVIPTKKNAGSYDVYYVAWKNGVTAPTVDAKVTVTIAQATGSVTAAPTAKDLTYTGLAQALVEAGAGTGTMLYSLDNSTWSQAIPTGTDATTSPNHAKVYYKVSASTDGNYSEFQPKDANEQALFVTVPVKQATLMVRAVSETIFYGQTPTLAIAYDGFVNGETVASLEALNNASTWTTPTVANPGTDAKKYDIIPANGVAKNYKLAYVGGKLTIDRAKVKIVARDMTAVYYTEASRTLNWTAKSTDTTPYFDVYVQNGWDANDPTKATYSTATATTTDILNEVAPNATTPDHTYKNLTVSRAAGTDVNTTTGYAITVAGGDFKANYQAGDYVKGKFTISQGALTFVLKNFSKIYGEEDPENWQSDYTMYMGTEKLKAADDPDEIKSKVTVTRVAGETAGSYDITLTVADKTSFTNFTITEPDPSVFYIERAPLTIVAKPQTLYVGNKVEKLVQEDYTVTGLVPENTTVNGVTINDAAEVSLAFATPVVYSFESYPTADPTITYATGTVKVVSVDATNGKTTLEVLTNNANDPNAANFVGQQFIVHATPVLPGTTYPLYDTNDNPTALSVKNVAQVSGVYVDADKKLNTEGTYKKAIKIVLGNEEDLANYNINIFDGVLTVIDTNNGVALSFTLNNTEAIEAASTTTTTKNVSFGTKTLKADNWYTMVLPFETTPAKLVAALKNAGNESVYAIVNTLSDQSTEDHISFKLNMTKIEANEPFLIKVAEDIDMANAAFGPQKIEKSATINKTAGGHTFQGVYAATDVQSTATQKIGWLATPNNNTQSLENKWYEPLATSIARPVGSLEAYLIYASTTNAPLITVEEFDGQTTAISEVKAGEFQAIKTDGWYTLNGVKLNGVPTEKGIYINNGKKVVVK